MPVEQLAHEVHSALLAPAEQAVALARVLVAGQTPETAGIVEEEARAALQQLASRVRVAFLAVDQREPSLPLHLMAPAIAVNQPADRAPYPRGQPRPLGVDGRAFVGQSPALAHGGQLHADALAGDRADRSSELRALHQPLGEVDPRALDEDP